jgi:hypothetical protein
MAMASMYFARRCGRINRCVERGALRRARTRRSHQYDFCRSQSARRGDREDSARWLFGVAVTALTTKPRLTKLRLMGYIQSNLAWLPWIQENWRALTDGGKLDAPTWLSPMPQSGFTPQQFASPEGQIADWTLSMSDRSRVHVHVLSDGRRVVHRDKHDPDQGIGDMVAHLTFETPYVALGGLALLVVAAAKSR